MHISLFLVCDRMDPPIEGGQLSNNKVCSGHSSNRCANNSNNNGNNNNNVGGPLMSVAHLNGQMSGINARGMAGSHVATSSNSITFNTGGNAGGGNDSGGSGSDTLTSLSTSAGNPYNHFPTSMDIEFDLFPNSTWDLDSAGWTDRPESRASGPSNSRPPSQPAPTASPSPQGTTFSNSAVAPHCSPLRPYSPTVNAAHTFSNSFPFSPLQDSTQTSALNTNAANGGSGAGGSGGVNIGNAATTTIKREETGKSGCPNNNSISGSGGSGSGGASGSVGGGATDGATGRTSSSGSSSVTVAAVETQNNSVVSTESGRLRNLLTKGPSANEDSQDNTTSDSDNQNKHRILKILLNQQDEDDYHSEPKVRTSPSNMPKPSSMEHSKSSIGNNMLLQVSRRLFNCLFP